MRMKISPPTAWHPVMLVLPIIVVGCAGANAPAANAPPLTESTLRLGSSGRIEIRSEVSVGRRSFGVPADEVWTVLPEVFEKLEVPVSIRDRAALQMGNAQTLVRRVEGKRMSTYLDCGTSLSGVLADAYDITLQMLVKLRPLAESDVRRGRQFASHKSLTTPDRHRIERRRDSRMIGRRVFRPVEGYPAGVAHWTAVNGVPSL